MARILCFDELLNTQGIIFFCGVKGAMQRILKEKEYQDLVNGNENELQILKDSLKTKQEFVERCFKAVESLPEESKQLFFQTFHAQQEKKDNAQM